MEPYQGTNKDAKGSFITQTDWERLQFTEVPESSLKMNLACL